MKALVLYMPVLHAGYLQLFAEVNPELVVLLPEDVLRELPDHLTYITKKDIIRAVPAEQMLSVVRSLDRPGCIASSSSLHGLENTDVDIILPDEDVSRAVAGKYFRTHEKLRFVKPPAPRLRYERNTAEERKLLVPDRRIAIPDLSREMLRISDEARILSPDWFRQVGGVLRFRNGKYIVGYNEHQPHEQIAATFGDPRALFKSGIRTDLSHGDHTEHVLIGEAARLGLSTDGAEMYLTTFPCLMCARLIVRAGVCRLYYRDPSYGLLDADAELRRNNMELIEVSA